MNVEISDTTKDIMIEDATKISFYEEGDYRRAIACINEGETFNLMATFILKEFPPTYLHLIINSSQWKELGWKIRSHYAKKYFGELSKIWWL